MTKTKDVPDISLNKEWIIRELPKEESEREEKIYAEELRKWKKRLKGEWLKMDEARRKLETRRNIEDLREFVWGHDIPSPTCPEYRELHEIMQEILKRLDYILER